MSTDLGKPIRPVDAVLHHPDGTLTALELVYVGVVNDLHTWESWTRFKPGDRLSVASLREHQTIVERPREEAPGEQPDNPVPGKPVIDPENPASEPEQPDDDTGAPQ